VRDAIHLLTPRAEEVGKRLLEEMAWYDNYLDMGQTAALTRLRATKKAAWQTWWKKPWARLPNPARAPLWKCSPGQRPTKRGLIYAATPASGLRHAAGGIRHYGAGLYHAARRTV
jgi:galactarate dehydratase